MVLSAANPTPSIDLRLLGPLSATVDGEPVSIGGPRQMAVLARLMLTPDQVVSMNQLVESVWDGDEPNQPQVAIRSYVSNLRRAIEPNRQRRSSESCLASSPPGYRLAIDTKSVDWVRFDCLVNEGRRHLLEGDPASAVRALRLSADLWGGTPCSGLPESPFFVAHTARLTELRETAVELLFEALLALGDHHLVAAEVEAAIAESPLRERLTELGMLAFYRSGRQSEALALGQRLRARLVEDLGVDPSRAIDTIELKILNHDSSLEPTVEEPAHPTPPTPRRVSATADSQPQSTVEPPIDPATSGAKGIELVESGPPIGRLAELTMLGSIQTALAAGRSATAIVTGEQGIGKSRLIKAAADDLAANRVKLAWSRSMPGEKPQLWLWAQVVLSLLGSYEGALPIGITPDLMPLAALGPSVAGALGIPPVRLLDDSSYQPVIGHAVTPSDAPVEGKPVESEPAENEPAESEPVESDAIIDLDSLADQDAEAPSRSDRSVAVAGSVMQQTQTRQPILLAEPSPQFDRAEVMLAVTGLLERLSERSPVTLVFEDLQWADEASVSLLSFAASSLADHPVGFMLTWRETDLAASPAATGLREFSRLPALTRIELDGLDDQAIVDLAGRMGRSLTTEETASIHGRCDGNPLFVREVLAHTDMRVGNGRRWSTVIDAVVDRVERLPAPASEALTAASLFRQSFSVAAVAPLCKKDPALVQEAFNQAVHGGILHEVDPTIGTYRFRQSLLAEVLASRLLAVESASIHQQIGRQLLDEQPVRGGAAFDDETIEQLGASGYEIAYHLSKSPAAADRLLAGRVGLTLARHRFEIRRSAEIDAYVDIALAAAAHPDAFPDASTQEIFVIDALLYESWRAWIDRDARGWQASGLEALGMAVASCTPAKEGRTVSRVKGQSSQAMSAEELEVRLDRLHRCTMNMIGSPVLPIGPSNDGQLFVDLDVGGDLLSQAAELLPADDPARWTAQIHLSYLQGLRRPGRSGQLKSLRDGQKTLSGARRRVQDDVIPTVLRTFVTRFAETIDPETRLTLLAEISRTGPNDATTALFQAHHAYPALLELGRLPEAIAQVETAVSQAESGGDPLHLAGGRHLVIRHLIWVGDLDAAAGLIASARAGWDLLGLPEPLSLTRQAVALAAMQRQPLPSSARAAGRPDSFVDQARRVDLALRFGRLGNFGQAVELLDQVLETAETEHLSLRDQAAMAMTAFEVGHEEASATAREMLEPYGDQLVLRTDGAVLLGPASLYASVAARGAGDRKAAEALSAAASAAVERFGGAPIPADLWIGNPT
ncbi:MAG: BTAD domain-containing putative transcriptional regulator [Acidimicrobiales bacterium]